jgi:hypothetical protein
VSSALAVIPASLSVMTASLLVIPAKAGIQIKGRERARLKTAAAELSCLADWTPACAGVTTEVEVVS